MRYAVGSPASPLEVFPSPVLPGLSRARRGTPQRCPPAPKAEPLVGAGGEFQAACSPGTGAKKAWDSYRPEQLGYGRCYSISWCVRKLPTPIVCKKF